MEQPLPPELAERFGNLPDLKYRGNNEWSSACPKCNPSGRPGHDPSDRFRMFSSGGPPRAWCRQCDWKITGSQLSGKSLSTTERQEAKESYYKWLQEENKLLRTKVAWLQKQEFWREWHVNMSDVGKKLWHRAGVSDAMINIHQLGYTSERYKSCGGALTIPYLHKESIQTLQFRLRQPPTASDKYRFLKGTRSTWFYAYPYDSIKGVVLVTEGVKKALVTWQTIALLDQFVYRGSDVTIVSTPSKYVPNHMLEKLEKADLVLWLLDPDALKKEGKKQSAVMRNAERVGLEKSRVIRTVAKIDDMIIEYDLNGKTIQNMIQQASPIIRPGQKRKAMKKYI